MHLVLEPFESVLERVLSLRPLAALRSLCRRRRSAYLPLLRRRSKRRKKKKTLVLDLDETLVHTHQNASLPYDLRVELRSRRGLNRVFYVATRPHLDEFLERASEMYELVVFTASVREYAEPVIDLIDPQRLITRRLFRDSCLRTAASDYVKDLTRIEDNLGRVLIVDNTEAAFAMQPDNAIPIDDFVDDMGDESLLRLIPFLQALYQVDDVRSVLELRRHKPGASEFPLT